MRDELAITTLLGHRMHRSNIISMAFSIAAAGSFASAGIVQVSEFDSPEMEGFQGLAISTFDSGTVEVFGGMAEMYNTDGSWVHTTGGWSYKQYVSAYEGDRLMGTSRGGVAYQFNSAQQSFGGYFSSISDADDGEIRFYAADQLVGVDDLIAPTDTQWAWNGWSSDVAFDRVEIRSNDANSGFLMHDAVRVLATQIPAPGGGGLLMGSLLVFARRRR
ncbi:MAG: hypothetical protein CMJ35_05690 [Phycisphaerae bacterium]|nr:hypothetical protein [Phycisphaerae bacterium]MBM91089.1 hypothetical protein [Phycisphaerae bacterium]HCT44844.1 hypothetical protein [Phycisphaerales bacterium]